jgi:hypothetical protein
MNCTLKVGQTIVFCRLPASSMTDDKRRSSVLLLIYEMTY